MTMQCDGRLSRFLNPSGPAHLRPNRSIAIDTETDDTFEIDTYCSAGVSPGSERDLIFNIRYANKFLLLNGVKLHLELRIMKEDGKEAISGAGDSKHPSKVVFVNNLAHSLFDQCTTYVNSTQVTNTDSSYHYRSWALATLQNSKDAKLTYLKEEGFFLDDYNNPSGDPDSAQIGESTARQSLKDRQDWIKKEYDDLTNEALTTQISSSKTVRVSMTPNEAIFSLDEVLPPDSDLVVHFRRAPDSYCLISAEPESEKFKIDITRAVLKIPFADYTDRAKSNYRSILQGPGVELAYPYDYLSRQLVIPANSPTFEYYDVFASRRPKRIIAFLVPTKTVRGDFKTDPLHLTPHKMKKLELQIDERTLPAFDIDWKRDWSVPYNKLHTIMERSGSDLSIGITDQMYKNGYCFYLLDTSINRQGGSWAARAAGVVTVRVTFDAVPTESMSLFMIGEFSSIVRIGHDKCVTYNSNA